jgi:hypothetical protein
MKHLGKVNNLYFVDWIYILLKAICFSRQNALIIAPASSGKSTLLDYITGKVIFFESGTGLGIIDAVNRTKADYVIIKDMAHLIRKKATELTLLLEVLGEGELNTSYISFINNIKLNKRFSIIAALTDEDFIKLIKVLDKANIKRQLLSRFVMIRYAYTEKEKMFIASKQLDTEIKENTDKIKITPDSYIDKAKYAYPLELFFAIHKTFSKEDFHLRTIKKMNRIYTALIENYKDKNRALGITTALLINQYKELNRFEFLNILALFANVGKQYFEFYKGEKISDLLSLALNKIKDIVKKEVVKNEGDNKARIITTSENEKNKS